MEGEREGDVKEERRGRWGREIDRWGTEKPSPSLTPLPHRLLKPPRLMKAWMQMAFEASLGSRNAQEKLQRAGRGPFPWPASSPW